MLDCGHRSFFYQGECRFCKRYPSTYSSPEAKAKRKISLQLPFSLTDGQKEASESLVRAKGNKIFLEAVCGAGKTEICLELLKKHLEAGDYCAWVIPRREIVLELAPRLQTYFPSLEILPLCQGYTQNKEADLLVMTSHQLYHYEDYFDLIILDEPDAFPFVANPALNYFLERSLKEQSKLILLSATRHPLLKTDNMEHISLNLRPSMQELPVPKWRLSLFWPYLFIKDVWKHRKEASLVYVPSIALARKWSLLLQAPMLCSKTVDKDKRIENFRKEKGILVCTTILERGVTFKDCFCFVLHADHPVFSKSSLIQIAGRVRRGMSPKKGICYFYSGSKDVQIREAIDEIVCKNNVAFGVLKT